METGEVIKKLRNEKKYLKMKLELNNEGIQKINGYIDGIRSMSKYQKSR